MIGIIAVCGLPLMAFTACNPSMPGMRWSMKMRSGRLFFRFSMACSADSAMSTSMSYFSSMRLKMTRADVEWSTTKALFRAIRFQFSAVTSAMVAAPSLVAPSLMPVAKSRRARSASLACELKRRAERGAPQALGRIGARRFLVLGNPGQRGFHIGEFTGGKSFDPDTRGFRLFLGEFRGCDGMHPDQTA